MLAVALVASVLLVHGWASARAGASQEYLDLIDRLQMVADSVAVEFREETQAQTAETFGRLEEWAAREDAQDLTLILFDARGRSYAWSGAWSSTHAGPCGPRSRTWFAIQLHRDLSLCRGTYT